MRPALHQINNYNQGDQNCTSLEPVPLDKPPFNEEWLQNLIHAYPGLVPAGEVESCFDNIIPVLREFWLPDGFRDNYLDNLYFTPDGYPVLVEVKLWKNQEARREVVVQILNYAKEFSKLNYEAINKEICRQNKTKIWGKNPLYEIVSEYTANASDEIVFIDRVSKNIREGRFLLLILGDGVREEMAGLAQYLLHHNLRYAFGIIQISFFRTPDGTILALPSVLAKTQTIERHVTVVTTESAQISVTAPTNANVISEKIEKTSLSTDEFYEKLGTTSPAAVIWLKKLLQRLEDIPVELSIGTDYAALIAPLSGGESVILMKINLRNKIEFWGLPNKKRKTSRWTEISKEYLNQIAMIVPESFVRIFESGHMDLYNEATKKSLAGDNFFGKEDRLAEAMREVIHKAEEFFASETPLNYI